MNPQKSRFVAACQQILVLGAVFAALVPAANVVSLDVVREHPSAPAADDSVETALAAYEATADRASEVPASTTEAVVHQVALTAPEPGTASAAVATGTGSARSAVYTAASTSLHATSVADTASGTTTIVSDPQDVTGFGTVGVTWEHGQDIAEGDIAVQVRTSTDGEWGEWADLDYHDEHGPDDGSAEAAEARPGTDEALVGHVDQVQVKAEVKTSEVPADMTLAVIDPGTPSSTKAETPDIDTNDLPTVPDAAPDADGDLVSSTGTEPAVATTGGTAAATGATGGIALAASATAAAKPYIYSRAQWGANEKLREQTAPSYGTIQGAFVHHTVNANDYTAAEVPGIIRSIYAYHVKSKGWRDIGYNFLVDRFGRIWEGRYGGVDRAVVGAHTENYNSYSFAMSAIGNYDIAQPSQEIIGAYASLFAWKLGISGVSAAATNVTIGKKVFASSIMGHRDTKSTACPGKYLYARIPDIRRAAAALQTNWTFATRNANLAGTAQPDIIARRASDKRAVIIPTTGQSGFSGVVSTKTASGTKSVLSPDLTGDGRADVVAWNSAGTLAVRSGTSAGRFGAAAHKTRLAAGRNYIAAVGDVNGDGRNDLAARRTKGGRLVLLLGTGKGTFKARSLGGGSYAVYNWIGGGDVDGNGTVDLIGRDAKGVLWWMPGNGKAGFGKRHSLGGGWNVADSLAVADFNADGKADVVYRNRSTKVGYVRLGTGSGFSGNLGPYRGFKKVGKISGAAQLVGGASPEVLAVGSKRLDLLKKKDTTDLGQSITTNLDLSSANLVLNAGDWNGDGKGDVLYRTTDGVLHLTLGDGAGTFSGDYGLGSFGAFSLIAAVGDMTGDGHADLMAQSSSGMFVYPGNGATGVSASYSVYSTVAGSTQIAAGLWDDDKMPDTLVRNGDQLVLYKGNGPGGLSSPRTVATGMAGYTWVLGLGALEVTGHAGIVVRDAAGTLYAMTGTSSGSLGKRRVLGYGYNGYDLAG
ncbi:MAG: FG-GAP-like repeat-containing protein [Nocardioides sp.]|uniref:FG-GAP-like repeat-containing protein n=1 Tax=Nocardioides sp. TaxID=35761 RepID=UPI0039E59768